MQRLTIPAQPGTYAVYDDGSRRLVIGYDAGGAPLVHGENGNLRRATASLSFRRIEEPTGG